MVWSTTTDAWCMQKPMRCFHAAQPDKDLPHGEVEVHALRGADLTLKRGEFVEQTISDANANIGVFSWGI